jgi:hypothetical protein
MSSESRERVERRLPGFILAKLKAILTPIVAPEVLAIYADGLRKAGLPEERGVALVWRRHRIMRDAAKGEGLGPTASEAWGCPSRSGGNAAFRGMR